MSDSLRGLPHQVPFRAVSRLSPGEEVSGASLLSAGDSQQFLSSELWILEAMAQTAGATVFEPGVAGRLAGVDRFRFERRVQPGDSIEFTILSTMRMGDLHRAEVQGTMAGEKIASAIIYLSTPDLEENS